ncbi:12326_t:CDS:2, partial [Cetraspora pellucida]
NALVDQTIEITTHKKSKKGQRGIRIDGQIGELNETNKLGIMNKMDDNMDEA